MLDWEGNMIKNRFRKRHKESNAMIHFINLEDYEKLVDETIFSGMAEEPTSATLSDISSGAQYEIASFSAALSIKRDLDILNHQLDQCQSKKRRMICSNHVKLTM